jgi:hypothetical protein
MAAVMRFARHAAPMSTETDWEERVASTWATFDAQGRTIFAPASTRSRPALPASAGAAP